MPKLLSYSIIIPVYNSEKTLSELHRRIQEQFQKLNDEYEIIFVDDNSHDTSWSIIKSLQKQDKRVKGIQMMDNYGQHNATFCGLAHTQGDYVITLDDDLQHPPEEIPKLINKIQEGYDIVYGIWDEHEPSMLRNLLSYLRKSITARYVNSNTSHKKYSFTSFRIIRKELTEKILHINSKFIHLGTFFSWYTSSVGFTHVAHHPRQYGKSNYSLSKIIGFSLNILLKLTDIPLKISLTIGIICSFAALLLTFYYAALYLLHRVTVPGYTSTIIAVTFFSGILLISNGINSLYLGKIYQTILDKPIYSIRTTVGIKEKQ